jgi:hypothetical protein
MIRRSFLKLLGGTAAAVTAWASPANSMVAARVVPEAQVIPETKRALFYVSLHTDQPNDRQDSHECEFGAYARQGVTTEMLHRDKWIEFPRCTGGDPEQVRYFGIGTNADGIGRLIFSGPLQVPVRVNSGVSFRLFLDPEFASFSR